MFTTKIRRYHLFPKQALSVDFTVRVLFAPFLNKKEFFPIGKFGVRWVGETNRQAGKKPH